MASIQRQDFELEEFYSNIDFTFINIRGTALKEVIVIVFLFQYMQTIMINKCNFYNVTNELKNDY